MKIAMVEEEYKVKYKEFLEVHLQFKKIEKNKESEYEKYKIERNKKNQKQTDEINSTRERGRNAKSI